MKSLEGKWAEFKETIREEVPTDQVDHLRIAFFSGCVVTERVFRDAVLTLDTQVLSDTMNKLKRELGEFIDETSRSFDLGELERN